MVARGQPTAGPLKCRGHYAAGGSASTPRVAVGTRARREQQVAQKVPLAPGALQESRLLVGCQAGEKAMQILGHVEDHVAALRAPLLEDLGQVATIEVRKPERVDDQRLEAVAQIGRAAWRERVCSDG